MLPQFLDRLDSERQQVFKKLAAFKKDFILGGGTAIMLQIGHRKSFDFDCFTQNQLPTDMMTQAKNVFGKDIYPLVNTREQITFKAEKDIEITFITYPFKPLRKPAAAKYIDIFHSDDLAANKAYTIGRRGAWRDYVDLFFFLQWKLYNMRRIITLAEEKFKNEFNPKLFLEQLVYFDDLNILPTEFLKESYADKQIQSFLEKRVEEYIHDIFPD